MIRLSSSLLALAFLLGLLGTAEAQVVGIAQDTARMPEAIVVTGEFSPAAQSDALRQVQIIKRESIEGMAALSARDVLRNSLGMRTSEDAILGSGLTVQGLRGENVKVLIDGVPVVGRLNGNVDLSQISLSDVSRIELVEGPMSVEYGTNALAGTVNFITDQSRAKRQEISTRQRYESSGQYTSEAHATLGRGGNFFRLGAQRNYFDGWSSGDSDLDWIQDFPADSSRVSAWNPKIQHDVSLSGQLLGERTKWTPSVRLFSEQIQDRGLPRAPYGERAFDNRYETYRLSSSLALKTFKNDETRWDVVAAWNAFLRQKSSLLTDLTTLTSTPLADATAQDTTRVDLLMLRGALNTSLSSRLHMRSGWDIAYESYAGPRVAGGHQRLLNAAAFGLGRYTHGKYEHQLGLRWAWNSTYSAPLLPSWHTLVRGENLRWRFSYARGFRAPSLKELHFVFVDVNHQLLGNPDLEAESSHNLQFSCSGAVSERPWQFSAFYNAVHNQIDFVATGLENEFVYRNIGEFRSYGSRLRVEGSGRNWNWNLGAAWTAQAGEISPSDAASNFTHTPEFTAQGGWSPVNGFKFFSSIKYNGSQLRYYESMDDTGFTSIKKSRLSPYTLMDATATYTNPTDRWTYSLGVRNILNVQDVAVASAAGAPSGAHSDGTSQMMAWGRTLVASLQWSLSPSAP